MAIPKKWFIAEERARQDRDLADSTGDRAAVKRHQAAVDAAVAKQKQHSKQ